MARRLVIDCFAGGGGASLGIRQALGYDVDIAINHDPLAIAVHKANHPNTLHVTEDIFSVNLADYVGGREVDLMWASPDCFTAGHLVWTDRGYVPIEDVRPMDYVLTHKGRMRMVTRFIKKSAYDLRTVVISGCEPQTVTPEHPYYARKKIVKDGYIVLGEPEWVEAKDLSKDYKVCVPINTQSLIPMWDGIVKERHNQHGITMAWHENELGRLMPNADFWWVVGRYFGDGYLSENKGMVDICCEKGEEEPDIRTMLHKTGIRFTERDKITTHSFTISSKELCTFLSQFGNGSAGKTITPTILNLPKDLLKSFIEGYISADGCWDTKHDNPICYVTTVSKGLAYGLQQCLLKAFGVYGCMRKAKNSGVIQGRKVNTKDAYQISFRANRTEHSKYVIENNMAWVNVRSVTEDRRTKYVSVYTLSVAEDESFTVGNVAVHNCTHFSKARGGKPRSQHIRMLPWAVHKHAQAVRPRIIIMENVAEIQTWEDYGDFIAAMVVLGYRFSSKVLCAADYGARTSRTRWYAVFRHDGMAPQWPVHTHASRQYLQGTIVPETWPLKPWLSVEPCLDTDIGKPVEGRKRPLAPKTLARIKQGNDMYRNRELWGWWAQWLMSYYGTGVGQSIHEPLRTITCKDRFALVTATTDGTCMRMLTPKELKLAQGFPAPYVIDHHADGTPVPKAAQVKLIGNSVVPLMAKKIVAANLVA